MFKLSVADLDSPSYFVAAAAVDLGFFKQEGVDTELQVDFGAINGPEALRDGGLHFFGGPAFAATRAFPAGHSGFLAGIGAGSWGALVAVTAPWFGHLFDLSDYAAAFRIATLFPVAGYLGWRVLDVFSRVPTPAKESTFAQVGSSAGTRDFSRVSPEADS